MKFVLFSLFVFALAATAFASPVGNALGNADEQLKQLEKLESDLTKIVAGLNKENKKLEAVAVQVFKNVVVALKTNYQDNTFYQKMVEGAINRGKQVTAKYAKYVTEQFFVMADDDQTKELEKLSADLKKIVAGLNTDNKKIESMAVTLFAKVVDALKEHKSESVIYKKAVDAILANGQSLREKYNKYLNEEYFMLVANEDDETPKELEQLVKDLEKIAEGLKKDGKIVQSLSVGLFKNIVTALKNNPQDNQFYKKAVEAALKKGKDVTEKYAEYLKEQEEFLVMAAAGYRTEELNTLMKNLETIEQGLGKDSKILEKVAVEIFKQAVEQIANNPQDDENYRITVDSVLITGRAVVEKYHEYLTPKEFLIMANDDDQAKLEQLSKDLQKIVAGLQKDNKKVESMAVALYGKIVDSLRMHKSENMLYKRAVNVMLTNGKVVTDKYAKYLKEQVEFLVMAAAGYRKEELAALEKNLELIENGLSKDSKVVEKVAVEIFRQALAQIMASEADDEQYRITVDTVLMAGRALCEKYHEYLTPKEFLIMADESENPDENLDDDDLIDDDKDNEVDDDQKEKNKDLLQKIKEKLEKLRDRLVEKNRRIKAAIVSRFIKATDFLLKKLQKIDEGKLARFLKKAKEILARFEEDLKDV